MRVAITTVLVLIFGTLLLFFVQVYPNPSPNVALAISLCVEFVAAPIFYSLVKGIENIGRLSLLLKTKLLYWNKDVRMSISYLYRIQVNGKYLLVKNRKWNYYQLVGGAYKAFPTVIPVYKKYGVKPDKQFATEEGIAKSDLRFMVPGRNVLSMIDWFNSQKDRETSQWREFCEELLTTGILDKDVFRYVDYTYAGTVQTPLRKAKHLPNQELFIFEIFDLVPNREQLPVLEALLQKGDTDEVRWASRSIIESLGFDQSTTETPFDIGPHTKWAIEEKWS